MQPQFLEHALFADFALWLTLLITRSTSEYSPMQPAFGLTEATAIERPISLVMSLVFLDILSS